MSEPVEFRHLEYLLAIVDRMEDGTINTSPCKYEAAWHNYKV
jgi:hypothetical protein